MLSSCATLQGYKDKLTPEKTQALAAAPEAPSIDGEAPNSRWVEAAPADLPRTDWVAGFNDGALSRLVDQALAANTDIRLAAERYRAALARLNISEAELLPRVSASARVSRTENGNEFIRDRTGLSGGLSADWEYDLWGRIRDGINSSELEASASKADFAGARLAIAARVTQSWFDLIEARLLTELSERDVETLARALRLTARRFEGGVTGSSDVRLARSSLANAQALLASRQQRQSALARSLEVLLREYPSESLVAAADLPQLPALSGAAGPAFVLRHRPDLLAAESRLSAAGLEVDAARKALLPRLSFDGGTNLSGTALNNIFDFDAIIASLAAGLTAPIFQGGRLKANIAQQEALLRQQIENYAGTALDAYLEVENALDAERRLAQREAALRVSLEEAIKAEERLELRYAEGLASILRLLDSQSRRISAESQLISARKERLANRVRLHVALGGGDITETAALPALQASIVPTLTAPASAMGALTARELKNGPTR
jgi:NodT family efflux transporter outer membrane factor (OMF) lipoprotein